MHVIMENGKKNSLNQYLKHQIGPGGAGPVLRFGRTKFRKD